MLRQALVAASAAGVILSGAGRAAAGPAWFPGSDTTVTPVEQRIAVSVGPARTTLWTSLRFSATGGMVGIVVPAPPGASLDWSSDAWMEALDVATAPRIFPPANEDPYCPGASGPSSIFETAGQVGHTASLSPLALMVIPDAAGVGAFASTFGLSLPQALQGQLDALSGVQFVTAIFSAPSTEAVTPTLRVVMPGAPPALPLALTRAGSADLLVTAWILGEGSASLVGGTQVMVPPASIAWKAAEKQSNYVTERASTLGGDPSLFVVECAGHAPLASEVTVASGAVTIDDVVSTYFERASAYGDGSFDSAPCVTAATSALASSEDVAASCPRAALGVVGGSPSCTETTPPGDVDPATLRCGSGADDLAVALSGLVPASTWVTRQSLDIGPDTTGLDFVVTLGAGPMVTPVVLASTVDTGACNMSSSSSSSSSGIGPGSSSSSSSSGGGAHGPNYTNAFGQNGPNVEIDTDIPDDGDVIDDSAPDTSCSCSGTESYSDPDAPSSGGCSGSSDPSSSSGCSGSSDTSSSSGSCSGSSSDGSSGCDSSSGGDDCGGGDIGGGDCSGGNSFDCSVAGPRRLRMPKFSILLLSALAVIVPLRRRGRRTRRR